jgi:hypothetical protein
MARHSYWPNMGSGHKVKNMRFKQLNDATEKHEMWKGESR